VVARHPDLEVGTRTSVVDAIIGGGLCTLILRLRNSSVGRFSGSDLNPAISLIWDLRVLELCCPSMRGVSPTTDTFPSSSPARSTKGIRNDGY
jgi:hypothetical protein